MSILLLAIVSSSAMADWVAVGSDEIGVTYYANPASIHKEGNKVKMWNVVDYTTARVSSDGKPYMSMKARVQYDCKEERLRTMHYSGHSEHMGRGKSVYSDDDPTKWSPVPRATVQEDLWEIACGKR